MHNSRPHRNPRRKNIAITEKGEGTGVIVKTLSSEGLDTYEQRVLMFLQLVSEDGVLDTDSIGALAQKAKVNHWTPKHRRKWVPVWAMIFPV
ncbi:MAG: DUF2207 domain-containing protein [Clostridiales bacterium]|nr:DUF2207 domain-containing protein [Clostridiales bacterium]